MLCISESSCAGTVQSVSAFNSRYPDDGQDILLRSVDVIVNELVSVCVCGQIFFEGEVICFFSCAPSPVDSEFTQSIIVSESAEGSEHVLKGDECGRLTQAQTIIGTKRIYEGIPSH